MIRLVVAISSYYFRKLRIIWDTLPPGLAACVNDWPSHCKHLHGNQRTHSGQLRSPTQWLSMRMHSFPLTDIHFPGETVIFVTTVIDPHPSVRLKDSVVCSVKRVREDPWVDILPLSMYASACWRATCTACHHLMPQALIGQWFIYSPPTLQTLMFCSHCLC